MQLQLQNEELGTRKAARLKLITLSTFALHIKYSIYDRHGNIYNNCDFYYYCKHETKATNMTNV